MTDMPRWASDEPDPNEPLVWQPDTSLFFRLEGSADITVNGESFGTPSVIALVRVTEVLEFVRDFVLVRLADGQVGSVDRRLLVVGRA